MFVPILIQYAHRYITQEFLDSVSPSLARAKIPLTYRVVLRIA